MCWFSFCEAIRREKPDKMCFLLWTGNRTKCGKHWAERVKLALSRRPDVLRKRYIGQLRQAIRRYELNLLFPFVLWPLSSCCCSSTSLSSSSLSSDSTRHWKWLKGKKFSLWKCLIESILNCLKSLCQKGQSSCRLYYWRWSCKVSRLSTSVSPPSLSFQKPLRWLKCCTFGCCLRLNVLKVED